MIYTHEFHGLPLQTGDIICTQDGQENSLFGQLWQLFGLLVPGEVDHCIIYLGPGGRCIESAARGVKVFDMPGNTWNAMDLIQERLLLDSFYGVAYPLDGFNYEPEEEAHLRRAVAQYCWDKAAQCKPYNFNLLDPQRDSAFYCSQLVYKAYLSVGIDLSPQTDAQRVQFWDRVVFPQEIWDACVHRRHLPG